MSKGCENKEANEKTKQNNEKFVEIQYQYEKQYQTRKYLLSLKEINKTF